MKNLDAIKSLGLGDTEARVYLTLLCTGGLKASAVAKELGIKRTTIYPILKAMAASGFVSVFFRHNERLYYAEKPTKIISLIQQKLDTFESIIPSLPITNKKAAEQIGLQFIETLPELKLFYTKILSEYKNKSYRVIGSAPSWEGLDPDWFANFRIERAKNKIKTQLLLTENSRARNVAGKALLRTFKYLPEKYLFQSTLDIYDNKILIVSPKVSSLAVVVNIPIMVDVFQAVFEMMWEMLGE